MWEYSMVLSVADKCIVVMGFSCNKGGSCILCGLVAVVLLRLTWFNSSTTACHCKNKITLVSYVLVKKGKGKRGLRESIRREKLVKENRVI
jgi:hypothetical protein